MFCAHLNGSHNAIGYYALQIRTDSVAELPNSNKEKYVAFPAVHLSFLAVDETAQRQGLGSDLLMDAFSSGGNIRRCGVLRANVGLFGQGIHGVLREPRFPRVYDGISLRMSSGASSANGESALVFMRRVASGGWLPPWVTSMGRPGSLPIPPGHFTL